jgi:hypothetical protein
MKSCALAMLLLCVVTPAVASDVQYLSGFVLNATSTEGISNVSVTLVNTGRRTQTDSLGLFRFDSCTAEPYLVAFQKAGYFPCTRYFRLDSVETTGIVVSLHTVESFNLDSMAQLVIMDTFVVLDTVTIGPYRFCAAVPQFNFFSLKKFDIVALIQNPFQNFLDYTKPKPLDSTLPWVVILYTQDSSLLRPRYVVNAAFRYVYVADDPWCCLELTDSTAVMQYVQFTPEFLELQSSVGVILNRQSLHEHFSEP